MFLKRSSFVANNLEKRQICVDPHFMIIKILMKGNHRTIEMKIAAKASRYSHSTTDFTAARTTDNR